jgi:hypothetical protein
MPLNELTVYENTLMIHIEGDNGMNAEGGIARRRDLLFNGVLDTTRQPARPMTSRMLAKIAQRWCLMTTRKAITTSKVRSQDCSERGRRAAAQVGKEADSQDAVIDQDPN